MKYHSVKKTLIAVTLAATSFAGTAAACTGIAITTTDNSKIYARTIEWGENNLNSKVIITPRAFSYTSTLSNGKPGLSWKSKYGFTGISVSDDRFIAEGVNEQGLTAGLFYFKDYGSLATFDPGNVTNNITDMDFVRWMLSQYKTVADVEKALKDIKIVSVYIDAKGQPAPTAHWRVSDKTGRSVVIEIVDNGKINIYENKVGVLTNSPDFPWHVTNLKNYINLEPGTISPRTFGTEVVSSFGAGTAFSGLPGSITPPDRFVRAAFYLHTAPAITSNEKGVSQAFHIMNNFDLPIGSEFGPKHRQHIPDLPSATQWTSVIDLKNLDMYYKTMSDSTIKKLDVDKLDFTAKEEKKLPLDDGGFFRYKEVVVK